MVMAVSWMSRGDYSLFAVLNLASNSIFGFVRVVVFQPALIHFRGDKNALTPPRYALFAAVSAGLVLASVAITLGVHRPQDAILLGISLMLPIGQDWLRYRCLVAGKFWRTALGEVGRAVATVLLLVSFTGVSPTVYQSLANGACALAIALQLGNHLTTAAWTPFREYRSAALLQSVDYAVGTLNSIIPMLILGGLGGGALIGGFRLAQTIFGPLNLLFSASSTKLLADGAVQASHAEDATFIRAGRRLAAKMCLLSAAIVTAGVGVIWLGKISLSGVGYNALLIGVLCVGAVAVTSGWAGIHNVVMRVLGFNRRVTMGRLVIVGTAWTAFFVGYMIDGVDGSVIAGFAVSAVMYPIAFVLPAQASYRIILGVMPRE
ncbi:hypothetical protein P9139_07470 [Curtobacterium flaccumfaciens]|nr:hypothetical protein P9139_07470 [Curtobacterium flaccumfaciens]